MSTLKKLQYLFDKKTKRKLVLMWMMILFGSFAEILGITIILPIVNLAMEQSDISENKFAVIISDITGSTKKEEVLLWLIGVTIVVYIIKNLYVCFMYNMQFKFAASIKRDVATKLMKSYLKQPYSFFLRKNTSELIRSVNTDTGQLFQFINNILSVCSNALTAICIIVFLAISNLMMTVSIAIVLGICLIIIIFFFRKKNSKNGLINQRTNGFLIKHLKQAFEGVKEIKIMNIEDSFIDQYDSTYKKSVNLEVKYSLYNTIPKYLIEIFAITSILGYLALSIIFDPNYTKIIPQLAVFCVAAYKLLPSVNALYASFNVMTYHAPSVELVYNDIKEADELPSVFDYDNREFNKILFEKEVSVENVTFRYEQSDKDVLNNVNLVIPQGKSVALVGASGGGKTTVADLILSLLQPISGDIKVDGVNIKNNLNGWREKIGYIPQNIYLIDDSIKNNIAFGEKTDNIDEERVWKALEEAQLKEFVESLPDRLNTEVGERGTRLSGGQRQRIGIARALYRNPEMLVFDEATSALDNETEKEVMKAIESLQGTKTILMIAHRLSTIENCDIVYKVENGTVIRER